jgi:pyruvate dehydrogenase E1 component alpha subunit
MGTQVARSSAEQDLAKRGSGYAMPYKNVDGNDLDLWMAELSQAIERGRRGEGPSYLVANTYRFRGHSMSDPLKYRSREEAEAAKARDPITLYEARLKEKRLLSDQQLEKVTEEVKAIVDDAVKFAESSPHPELSELYTDILSERYPLEK